MYQVPSDPIFQPPFTWRWQIYVRFEGLSPYIACLICRSKAVLIQGILCWRDCIICLVLLGKLCLSHFVNLSFTARFIICQYCELLHSCKCIFKCLFRRAVAEEYKCISGIGEVIPHLENCSLAFAFES